MEASLTYARLVGRTLTIFHRVLIDYGPDTLPAVLADNSLKLDLLGAVGARL